MSDFETLSSGALAYRPWRRGVADKAVGVRGTGVAATDTAAFQAAATVLNGWGGGTLWLEGHAKLNGQVDFTTPVSLRGLGSGAVIESVDQNQPLAWNRTWYYTSLTQYDTGGNSNFDESFTPSAGTPVKGDWVMMWASNAISGAKPHAVGGNQYPLEIHQIYHNISGVCYVESFIKDAMSTSPKYGILSLSKGIVIDNIEFMLSDSFVPNSYAEFLEIRACQDVVIENCIFHRRGVGAVNIRAVVNVRFWGNHVYGHEPPALPATGGGQYGVNIQSANGVLIADNRFIGFRHAVTTDSEISSGTPANRWGCPLNIRVRNNVFDSPPLANSGGLENSGGAIMDTHAEGWGIIFENNIVNVGGCPEASPHHTYAMWSDARHTIVRYNIIRGYSNAAGTAQLGHGLQILGPDSEVYGNKFENLYDGVFLAAGEDYQPYAHRTRIHDNDFKDIRVAPIQLSVGDDHDVWGNEFTNCGVFETTTPQQTKCHIQLGRTKLVTSVSFTISTTTVTATDHPFEADMPIGFSANGGSLPSNVDDIEVAGTTYWVKEKLGDDTFTISATKGGDPITFASAGSGAVAHYYQFAGTGIKIHNNTSFKGDNTYFIETNNANEDDVKVYGNTIIGYTHGEEYSDRYGHQADLHNEYGDPHYNTIYPAA